MTNSIHVDINPPFAEIIFNKPERRNALSADMWEAIPSLVDEANLHSNVKVIIIHGGNAGAFAAGADISEFESMYSSVKSSIKFSTIVSAALDAIENSKKPTIAAIDGACVGGGVSIAMACDLRIASEDSKLGVTPSRLGIVYPVGDTRRLIEIVGLSVAKELLLTGQIFSAKDAHCMRLINRLAPKNQAIQKAYELANQISSVSQWSTQATKVMIKGVKNGWNDSTKEAQDLFLDGFTNEDFEEGYKAFLEKRSPRFNFI